MSGWLENYRRFWDESLDRLDDYVLVSPPALSRAAALQIATPVDP